MAKATVTDMDTEGKPLSSPNWDIHDSCQFGDTPGPMALTPKIPNRIKELRLAAGLSLQGLADRVGTSKAQIDKLERGERRLTLDWMIRLGSALQKDPSEFLPPGANGAAPLPRTRKNVSDKPRQIDEPLRPFDLPMGERDLPIRGRAQGGSNGVLVIPEEQRPVDYAYRPIQLRGVTDAFAIYAYEDSMRPMYKSGQILWIHPHLPVRVGDGVLVILTNDHALVKELVRRTDKEVRLKLYHPKETEISIPRDEVRHIYRVVGAIDPI